MVMRVGGLASGMDIDSIVKKMMESRKAPLTKLTQKKQIMEWQRDDYKSINSKLLDFRNTKLFEFKKDSTFSAKQASVSGGSDIFSVKATTSAVNGPIYVGVEKLATAASSVADLSLKLNNFGTETSYNMARSIKDYVGNLETGTDGKVELMINQKRVSFSFDPSVETLDALIYKINTNVDSTVSAYFDSSAKKISFVSKNTGKLDAGITITDVSGSSSNIATELFGTLSEVSKGNNATVFINGIESTQASNTFTVNGTEIMVKGLSPKDTSSPLKDENGNDLKDENGTTRYKVVASTINVTSDTTKVIDSIKSFISDYNTMLSGLYEKINEKFHRSFQPLTSDQKSDMKEKEIEQWEAKARSGQLRNDSILSRAYYDFRSIIASQVETGSSKYKTLSSIGIETGKYEENGKLYLKDEAKLIKALQEEPEAVKALFRAPEGPSTTPEEKAEQIKKTGLVERLYTTAYSAIADISVKAGTSRFSSSESFKLNEDSLMGRDLTSLSKKITSWTSRLKDIESRYYSQFTAMEKAISKYNNQSAAMTNMFNSK